MESYRGGAAGRLADDLFLIAHDDYSGKAVVAPNLLDTTLAGAVLGELALENRISIMRSQIYVDDHRAWHEPVSDRALGEIVHRGDGHPVRSWLEFLGPQARYQVGDRLVSAGAVRRETGRTISLRSTVRWPGTDPNRVAVPRVKLSAVLERSDRPLDPRTALLAALVHAGRMIRVLNLPNKAQAIDRIGAARRLLPPALRDLLDGVDATIAAAAMMIRR
nr:GPP34 family phosphoprotein [Micromonospora sp. DSM 115978]